MNQYRRHKKNNKNRRYDTEPRIKPIIKQMDDEEIVDLRRVTTLRAAIALQEEKDNAESEQSGSTLYGNRAESSGE